MSNKLTKKQRKEFLRLWIGANLLHLDFGFDETDIECDDINLLNEEKYIVADKYLKENEGFTSTKEIFEYVKTHY